LPNPARSSELLFVIRPDAYFPKAVIAEPCLSLVTK
jgi:hypothetical protein